jgi:hypothetical protein
MAGSAVPLAEPTHLRPFGPVSQRGIQQGPRAVRSAVRVLLPGAGCESSPGGPPAVKKALLFTHAVFASHRGCQVRDTALSGGPHHCAERAADELHDPGGAAGVRHLLPAQPLEGAGHDRDRRGAEPGAAADQGRAEQPVTGVQPGQHERDRARGGQRDPGQDDEAGAGLVGELAGLGVP